MTARTRPWARAWDSERARWVMVPVCPVAVLAVQPEPASGSWQGRARTQRHSVARGPAGSAAVSVTETSGSECAL